jgi:hypothetical protein
VGRVPCRVQAISQKWVDNAVAIGSPSIRTNLPEAKDSKPDNCRHHETARLQGYRSMEWEDAGDPNQGTAELIRQTVKYLS